MRFINIVCLLFGLFFLYKMFRAPNLYGGGNGRRRRTLNVFGDDAGKVDCGILAALMFIGAFIPN